MENFSFKKENPLWVMMMVPLVYLASVWNSLPGTVPIHFAADGTPNGWGGKWAELILPGIGLLVYLVLLFIRQLNPQKISAEYFHGKFYAIRFAVSFLLAVLSVVVIHAALPGASHQMHWTLSGIFLFFGVMGYLIMDAPPNWFVGIRTPWTLSNAVVWRKTHQLAGRVWLVGGFVCFALSLLVHTEWVMTCMIIFMAGSALFFAGYSYWLFKQEEKKG